MVDEAVKFGMEFGVMAAEKIDIDAVWDETMAALDPATTTVSEMIGAFAAKLMEVTIGTEVAGMTIQESKSDEHIAEKIAKYITEVHGIEIELPEPETEEPPKLHLVE